MDEPENIVLVHLRRIDAKLDDLREDVASLRSRVQSLERQVATFISNEAGHFQVLAEMVDTIQRRQVRMERRLDLTDENAARPSDWTAGAGRTGSSVSYTIERGVVPGHDPNVTPPIPRS